MAEEAFKSISSRDLPLNEADLESALKYVKKTAISNFRKKAVGQGISEEFIGDLKGKLSQQCKKLI
jgi:hypothetical protein